MKLKNKIISSLLLSSVLITPIAAYAASESMVEVVLGMVE